MVEYCLITKEELAMLIEDSLILSALECGGVDNQEGYGISIQQMLKEYYDENTTIEDIVEHDLNLYETIKRDS